MLRSEYVEYPGAMYHTVANRDYSFEIWARDKQAKGELRGAKLATSIADDTPGNSPELRGFADHEQSICAACRFNSLPLRMLVESPEFEPIEAIEEWEQGNRRIRYSARYLGAEGNSRRKDGIYSIIVDPAEDYRMLRGEITIPNRADEYVMELSYHAVPNVFVPKTRHTVRKKPDESYVAEWLTEIELPQKFNIPREEFRLEHYGFDESVLHPVSRNRWLRWLLVAVGVASLALGYWLLARRKAKG